MSNSRIIKRVPYDFESTIASKWGNVYACDCSCEVCHGAAVTPSRRAVERLMSLIVNVASKPDHKDHQVFSILGVHFDDSIHELIDNIVENKIENNTLVASAVYTAKATAKFIESARLPPEWGVCQHCHGTGIENAIIEFKEPPKGDGWQLWIEEFELLPISPVFRTPEGLAQWCSDHLEPIGYQQWFDAIKKQDMSVFDTFSID